MIAINLNDSNRQLTIGGDEVFIVAEIGKNFIQTEEERSVDEYLKNAKILIDKAAESGVDAVKFQTHEAEDEQANIQIVSPHFPLADRYRWVARNTRSTPIEFWQELKKYSEERGLFFFSTPMSRGAAIKLRPLDLQLWKVGSGDVDDFLLLNHLISTGKPIIISSGMVSLAELSMVMERLKDYQPGIGLLYCVSEYPCPPEHFNLATIGDFIKNYPWAIVGFSDHSVDSIEPALAAINLGARIIEKHFSLDRNLWGPDHKSSSTPEEFTLLVKAIRRRDYLRINVLPYVGQPNRELEGATNKFRPYFKKTLVAATELLTETKINAEHLLALRPRMYLDGISVSDIDKVIGRKLLRNLGKYEPVQLTDLE